MYKLFAGATASEEPEKTLRMSIQDVLCESLGNGKNFRTGNWKPTTRLVTHGLDWHIDEWTRESQDIQKNVEMRDGFFQKEIPKKYSVIPPEPIKRSNIWCIYVYIYILYK